MSVLIPTTMNGVSFDAHAEYTHENVATPYRQGIQVFLDVFNLPTTSADAAITSGGFNTIMENSLKSLITLATDGLPVPNDPGDFSSPTRNWKMSIQMISGLDQLIRSLEAAGINIDVSNPASISISVQDIKNWRNLTFNSNAIKDILNFVEMVGGDHNTTLQALTELIYIKTGNEIISDSLEGLEDALSNTKDALAILNEVQQLHNEITAIDKISFKDFVSTEYGPAFRRATLVNGQVLYTEVSRLSARIAPEKEIRFLGGGNFALTLVDKGSDPSMFGFLIPELADQHFGPLSPQLSKALSADIGPAIINFLELGEKLRLQISELSKTTPLVNGEEDSLSLLGKIRVVYNDMNRVLAQTPNDLGAAVKNWILDSYSTSASTNTAEVGEPGELQQNITNAITAGQNLNDQQKEEVRRFLFVFEEYYKSASAILNKLTQLIEKMAQGIAR